MTYRIRTVCEKLSDKSEVFTVVLTDADGAYLPFDMISEQDALTFGARLQELIQAHTNSPAELE